MVGAQGLQTLYYKYPFKTQRTCLSLTYRHTVQSTDTATLVVVLLH
jgi:hypothetical protein